MPTPDPPLPQTILQLYGELRRQAYGEDDLTSLRAAHDLAVEVFSGRLTPSRKTFLAHCVGTAGVLARIGAPPHLVTAGMVHNVYGNGEFGDGTRRPSPAKQAEVVRRVGRDVEAVVAGFRERSWSPDSVAAVARRVDALEPTERDVVLLRLADGIDHLVDDATAYCPDGAARQRQAAARLAPSIELWLAFGHPQMADLQERLTARAATVEPPAPFRQDGPSVRSTLVAPRSHRRTLPVVLRQARSGVPDRVRSLAGSLPEPVKRPLRRARSRA